MEHKEHTEHENHEEEISLKKIILAAVLFALGIFSEKFLWETYGLLPLNILFMAFYAVSYILCGLGVIKEAVENLVKGEFFGEEFLMAAATIGAIFIGEYSEAVAVMILFQLGEFLEERALDNSKKSITNLMNIRPDSATLKTETGEKEVSPEQIEIGQIIIVKPGERVPLDGKIIKGKSFVDTSALTGESVPREIYEGDEILSGFVNTTGVLEIEVTKVFSESTVSRVLEMVENAQGKKTKSEKFIRRFAKIYTPIVCLLALCIAVIPPLVFASESGLWSKWIYRALELLVVSCPCAFVISVPLSFFSGIGLASKNGILIKGSNYIEMLSHVKTVVFDKTGTLTKGVFEVSNVHLLNENFSKEQLIEIAAHAEYYSGHPISKSLKNIHHCEKCETLELEKAEEISGHGIKCRLEGKTVLAGNSKLMKKENVLNFSECEQCKSGTIVHIAVDGIYAGHIEISDKEKDDSKLAIDELKKNKIKTVMLTGDGKNAGKAVAEKLGLDEVYAELLPQDKVSKIEQFLAAVKNKKERVAFAGDGINDAPVLSRSDIGIAMGGLGSDAAIEAADVVIMDDMPSKIPQAISIAKKTMVNALENSVFALTVKFAIIVCCTFGIANMWMAVFGDVGVTLLAVLNSLRLLAVKKIK